MMWIEVKDDAAIEKLMEDFSDFHDSVILSISYNSGTYFNEKKIMQLTTEADGHTLLMTLQTDWDRRLEMLFTGVRGCNIGGFRGDYPEVLGDATLEFRTDLKEITPHTPLIVWANYEYFDIKQYAESFNLYKSNYTTYVIADSLKYRFLEEGE